MGFAKKYYYVEADYSRLHPMTLRPFNAFKEHPEAIAAIACGILLLAGWLALQSNLLLVGSILLAFAYLIGGYESALEGWNTLWQEKELDVDLLMIVAALGAAGLGIWKRDYSLAIDGAVLILIFAISGALENYAMQRTARSIKSLMSLAPDRARLAADETMVNIEQLRIGDRLLVKPGELIPTDAIVRAGQSAINRSAITGEALPVETQLGEEVFGGTINGNGVLELEVHRPPASSLIQRIVSLVQQAQAENTPSQNFIERFERIYAKIIVVAGLAIGTLPALLGWWDWETTIYRSLIFLVVASPCALMAAIMPGLLSGIATGARQGILFKNASTLEAIGKVGAIAFDKTGTLTTGHLQVAEIWYLDEDGEASHCPATEMTPEAQALLVQAAAIESGSEHLIGRAIATWAKNYSLELPVAAGVVAEPGVGISGLAAGVSVRVGKAPLDLIWQDCSVATGGETLAWVSIAGKVRGAITLRDTLRPEALGMIQHLISIGIHPVLLTGDNVASGAWVAQELGIPEFHGDLLPTDKIAQVKTLQEKYGTVAMVGDGINDAPAIAAADVGIAMGQVGSDVALETADMVLMSDALDKLRGAIDLSRRANRVVVQNVVFALTLIVLLLIGNFSGSVNLPLGVLGHEGSTVLVTLSGLRLLRFSEAKPTT
jgi:Zn2+/Cd2+-exporting ATPase